MGKKINFSKFFLKSWQINTATILKIIYDSAACHDPKLMNFKKKQMF